MGWVYVYDDSNKILILSMDYQTFLQSIEIIDSQRYVSTKEEVITAMGMYHAANIEILEVI